MGHQDSDLELRAIFEAAKLEEAHAAEAREVEEATPLALDHDAVRSWRETARFFRKAA